MSRVNSTADGLWKSNPVFVMGIGLFPPLAVSTSLENGLWMAAVMICVLIASNVTASLLRTTVSSRVRLFVCLIIISTLVTIAEMSLMAWRPRVYNCLGIYLPLAAMSCLFLERAESFASANQVARSAFDGAVTGIGFGIAITIISLIREALGANSLLGYTLVNGMEPSSLIISPPGAFFILGLFLWAANSIRSSLRR